MRSIACNALLAFLVIALDATAAADEALHVGALQNAAYGFAATQSTEELLSTLCLKSC